MQIVKIATISSLFIKFSGALANLPSNSRATGEFRKPVKTTPHLRRRGVSSGERLTDEYRAKAEYCRQIVYKKNWLFHVPKLIEAAPCVHPAKARPPLPAAVVCRV